MMVKKFECTDDDRWYLVMPEYDGPEEDLEMVDNTDFMLEVLAAGYFSVTLDLNL